ncbi:hypothetical protein PAPYR_808 [Paratrimastix pyriformis]|uniref:Uncharacterized protein n=1 Tax=Paratrimastix pyriformis TaxID=342808 RepID=A0ABQ8UYZ2_9EUKA|nr:hypothetical protein PAPYR_808 [Paratrimastix pyriformis]
MAEQPPPAPMPPEKIKEITGFSHEQLRHVSKTVEPVPDPEIQRLHHEVTGFDKTKLQSGLRRHAHAHC